MLHTIRLLYNAMECGKVWGLASAIRGNENKWSARYQVRRAAIARIRYDRPSIVFHIEDCRYPAANEKSICVYSASPIK